MIKKQALVLVETKISNSFWLSENSLEQTKHGKQKAFPFLLGYKQRRSRTCNILQFSQILTEWFKQQNYFAELHMVRNIFYVVSIVPFCIWLSVLNIMVVRYTCVISCSSSCHFHCCIVFHCINKPYTSINSATSWLVFYFGCYK